MNINDYQSSYILVPSDPCLLSSKFSIYKKCTADGKECDKNEYCHIGVNETHTICCPRGKFSNVQFSIMYYHNPLFHFMF